MGWKGPPKLTNSLPEVWLRVGLLASDPLRILGLEAIFADESGIEMVPLTGVLDVADLSLVMIDAVYTDHLFELLAMLRRKHPRLKMIVIGIDTDPAYIQRVIGAGVKGYLTHKLLESSSAIASEPAVQVTPKITQREEQVLRLLVAGRANREIASSLGIDAVTVKAHVGRLMRKVGVQNRIALSMHAVTRNLLQK
jgi:DNA-binding NarL/FixJ family response regulator